MEIVTHLFALCKLFNRLEKVSDLFKSAEHSISCLGTTFQPWIIYHLQGWTEKAEPCQLTMYNTFFIIIIILSIII